MRHGVQSSTEEITDRGYLMQAVFLVLRPWGGVVVPLPGGCRSAEARDQGRAA
ncbi:MULTISPECIES: hypothetical protein [Kocuria]|uniref:hypothetical protein n=1 Tax=Kocuria TaxID=57493 RepID=UPI000B11A0CB|nr:hypothetical protein [Kocuria sp. ICS0012]